MTIKAPVLLFFHADPAQVLGTFPWQILLRCPRRRFFSSTRCALPITIPKPLRRPLMQGLRRETQPMRRDTIRPAIPDGMNRAERLLKRMADIAIALLCLLLFAPIMLACYLAVRLDDGAPALFKQTRIGRYGRPFSMYKFRSMHNDAEAGGPQLCRGRKDPRLTRVGRFLREHHLDELPQLWNVLRGDMAFIGPRPERRFYIEQIIRRDPRYPLLYQIRPGVTSYATLYNGYTDTPEKMLRRLELDLYYLEHRSLFLDLKILWLTFCRIVAGRKF